MRPPARGGVFRLGPPSATLLSQPDPAMFELVKKSIYVSLGLASLTKDKLQQLATDVSKEAKLTEEQGRAFHAELQQKVTESRKELEDAIDRRIDHALVQLGIVKAGVKDLAGRTTDALQSVVDRRVDAALERLKVARIEDVEALARRVELLEPKAE